jgi:hypothetical protein
VNWKEHMERSVPVQYASTGRKEEGQKERDGDFTHSWNIEGNMLIINADFGTSTANPFSISRYSSFLPGIPLSFSTRPKCVIAGLT